MEASDPAAKIGEFLEISQTLQTIAGKSPFWNPVYEAGTLPNAAFFIAERQEQSIDRLIRGKVRLQHVRLLEIVRQIVNGLRDLKQHCNRTHGNIKPSNVLIKPGEGDAPWRAFLTDIAPASQTAGQKSTLADIEATGKVLYEIVIGRPFTSRTIWPLEMTPEWELLGAKAAAWRSLCNLLLDPELPATFDLDELEIRLKWLGRPNLKPWLIGAGVVTVMLLGAAVAFRFFSPNNGSERLKQAEIRQLLAAATDYENSGNFSAANDAVQRILGLDANNARARQVGLEINKRGEEEQQRRKTVGDLLAQAQASLDVDELDKADVAIAQILALDANNADAQRIKSQIAQQRQHDRNTAEQKIREVNQLLAAAAADEKAGNLQRAANDVKEALKYDPGNPAGLRLADEINRKLQQQLAAEEVRRRIAALLDQALNAFQNRQQYAEALTDLDAVEKIEPNNADAERMRTLILSDWLRLAQDLIDKGNYDAAAQVLAQIKGSVPVNAEADKLYTEIREARTPPRWTNSLGMRFIRLNAGDFCMGEPDQNKVASMRDYFIPLHRVSLTHRFYIAMTSVTVGQFRQYMAQRPNYQTTAERKGFSYQLSNGKVERVKGRNWLNPGFSNYLQSADDPVVCVSWNDASDFCQWLSKTENMRYRLQTEAEWEYACRCTNSLNPADYTSFPWGNRPEDGAGRCNVADQSYLRINPGMAGFGFDDHYAYTSPVGRFKPNAWGFFDIVGDVWELTDAYYDPKYPDKPETDPHPLAKIEHWRTVRGGAFESGPDELRCGFHGGVNEDYSDNNTGFRVVREIED
ncbi:MAG: SUMF1/EgtB/PvdO family nonheme iron enzyme [Tepidisphaeraceae bacterium]